QSRGGRRGGRTGPDDERGSARSRTAPAAAEAWQRREGRTAQDGAAGPSRRVPQDGKTGARRTARRAGRAEVHVG
ncbi:hypothetical protein, partial [Streptomyces pristinaespiralis]|uniref:hypothetical protein n=1 Tax=Streptomyces pristinaespiralis TaxID=38300 RepID=UPI0039864E04